MSLRAAIGWSIPAQFKASRHPEQREPKAGVAKGFLSLCTAAAYKVSPPCVGWAYDEAQLHRPDNREVVAALFS